MTTTPMRSLPHLPLIPVARALRVLEGVGRIHSRHDTTPTTGRAKNDAA